MQRNILENLFRTTEKYPEKTAVIDESAEITYAALWDAVARIGACLAKKLPGEAQESVIVFIDKSIVCLKAMLGTLYSGHFYVVMDVKTPSDRFAEIVSTLENRLLITTEELAARVMQMGYTGQICFVDALENAAEESEESTVTSTGEISEAEPWKRRIDTDLAYVLFTSGSTGIPKGVAVTHRSLIDYVDAYVAAVSIEERDVLGNQSPFFFDVSLKDIYMAQKTGATLCIVPTKYFMTPKKLLNFLDEKQVTVIAWVPTAYRLIAQFDGLRKVHPNNLSKFIFSGESMPTYVYNYWKTEYPHAVFIQQYGPTEITGACVNYVVEKDFADDEAIPIGQAFPNTDLFLLDEENGEISSKDIGRVGEIIVRGSCLAMGYYNNPEKTREVFTQNPLQDRYPETVYRTGDLAYWNDREELIFVSRKDFQIKHSGHRIELGEVENGILAIDGIDGCCCVQNRRDDEIVCYYISTSLEKKDIMIATQKKLPKYMMPTVYYKMDELPLLSNGKVDRKTLDRKANQDSEDDHI